MQKPVLLSGVKPTGRPHIGNYFGAMRQFVDLQNKYNCYFMIADYHALNSIQNANEMRENILNLAIDYLAIGLDPKKAVIFKQSDVSAHTELCWIFDSITDIPYLARAHAFKAAVEKFHDTTPAQRSLSSKLEQLTDVKVGVFNYPMLMAADILLYDTDVVPVGQDQKQHIEYARDTAQKFNNIFGQTFKLPKDLIIENVKTVPGIDGRKMSKSYGNTIGLFDTDEEIKSKVMSIVTDSYSQNLFTREAADKGEKLTRNPTDVEKEIGIPVNVFMIHKLIKSEEELRPLYESNRGKYKILKEALVKDLQDFIRPLRERREKFAKNPKKVLKILAKGAKSARKVTERKMEIIRKQIGVTM